MSTRKEKSLKLPAKEAGYTKNQLISASLYQDKRDLLTALLEEGKEYSFQEADELINRYLKGRVK